MILGLKDPLVRDTDPDPCRILTFYHKRVEQLKGTVRPDWICIRVVSLERTLKGHQPLYVFNFLFLILNIL
jgi:hypothetical protein